MTIFLPHVGCILTPTTFIDTVSLSVRFTLYISDTGHHFLPHKALKTRERLQMCVCVCLGVGGGGTCAQVDVGESEENSKKCDPLLN